MKFALNVLNRKQGLLDSQNNLLTDYRCGYILHEVLVGYYQYVLFFYCTGLMFSEGKSRDDMHSMYGQRTNIRTSEEIKKKKKEPLSVVFLNER